MSRRSWNAVECGHVIRVQNSSPLTSADSFPSARPARLFPSDLSLPHCPHAQRASATTYETSAPASQELGICHPEVRALRNERSHCAPSLLALPPSTSTVLPLTPSISPRAQQGRKSRCIRTSNPKFPGTHFACVREQVGFGAATQATLPPAAPPARTTLGAAADTDVATQDADPCPCLRLFLAYHLPAFLPQVHLLPASALCRSIPRSWKQQEKEQAQAPHTSTSSSSPCPRQCGGAPRCEEVREMRVHGTVLPIIPSFASTFLFCGFPAPPTRP
ncbi:hypothetical protein B0H14DRAFT_3897151 [Mycena olivaceomarginata]|nr:hypothetical protein B0H14DRAFT_3897151 [Mycena olivaceomarginata]